ncbi:MAG TPA: FGGY family carbohydrate kinase [Ktedonobacterales bacterium]|nr:FGGY family carbohydrate kinase [Ktedonobacterales bacterium]
MAQYVLALDQGTTSSRAILFNHDGAIVQVAQQEFPQIYPKPGLVEHNPEDIWNTQLQVAQEVVRKAGTSARDIAAIGITNQRETALVWERDTGRPIFNAIVWQSRLTAPICDELKAKGFDKEIRARTGLVTDAYFSGTKVKWILDTIPSARERARRGEILFGNVDTFLIWRLTRGKAHVTDFSNASRTLLFNIRTLNWDDVILKELDIPRQMLPRVMPSSGVYDATDPEFFGGPIQIAGDAGDQQAATFGQLCYEVGQAKNTYGTGSFMLMNTGNRAVESKSGLLTTIG